MMIEEEVESCASRAEQSQKAHPRNHSQKLEVYNEVLRRIRESKHEEADIPDFDDQLWLHFNRLPARYAFDVNVERAEDVLAHMRLLKLAEDPANRPALQVRLVQVQPFVSADYGDSTHLDPSENEDAQSSFKQGKRIHLPPTFASSSNHEALACKRSKNNNEDGDDAMDVIPYSFHVVGAETSSNKGSDFSSLPMHEITFSTVNKLKVLSQLTALLSEIGLNIQEAHAFSTNDGFSLDVFVVDGWPNEDTEELKAVLGKEILKFKEQYLSKQGTHYAANDDNQERTHPFPPCIEIPSDGTDVWEINTNLLKFENKVGAGSFGDLYKGTYCSQIVAIKVLKPERTNTDMLREFAQEVYIMRKIRHRNVVQFIGACTRPPNLCIVTEFMSRGSVYDFLRKQRGVFKLPSLLKVAIDVSKGMNYLHQNNIIHRDLKTANLLMDENEVVKVADFGVARVKIQSGVMTAETGTYRWMAPEIIEHKPYDQKADVFSFGITLWELLTRELPYSYLTPLQAAVGVVQKGLRPTIPKSTHPRLSELLQRCWQQDPKDRPEFSEIIEILQLIAKEVIEEKANHHKDKSPHGFLSALKWGHH